MRRPGFRFPRAVALLVGYVLLGIAVFQAACGGLGAVMNATVGPRGLVGGHDLRHVDLAGPWALFVAALITAAAGAAAWAYGRNRDPRERFGRREGILAVAGIWLGASLLGGLPYVFALGMDPVDALFEAVSGFTTTGATVVAGDIAIETHLSRDIMLWRSLTQWLGGMGIVVLFVAVFPGLGVGGKHMFRSEVPGVTADGLVPRIAGTSIALWRIYAGFTILCVLCFWLAGMTVFEAVCHAFTALSTGGFSTLDGSIGGFGRPAVEWVATVFMLIAGVNFGLYYAALRGRNLRAFARSTEFRVYVGLIAVTIVVITLGILPQHGWRPLEALRYASFTVATFLTSTGYGAEDYMTYSPAVLMLIVVIMVIGACSGSTAGGVKVERVVLMMKMAFSQFRHTFRPNVVNVVRMNGHGVEGRVLREVAVLVIVYGVALAGCTFIVLLLDPVDIPKAFGATLTCLSNMGPAPFNGGADHFANYSAISKLLFSGAMVLGRLEFYTLLALLVPDFWRR